MTPEEVHNRFSLFNAPEANPNRFLSNLSASLKKAFGDHITIEMRKREMVLTIGPKTAWIDHTGALVGEASTPPSLE